MHHEAGTEKHASPQSLKKQKALIDRLNRVEGQIRGIKNMIENETYCFDIINQIEASRAAMGSISKILMESHLKHCIVDQLKNEEEGAEEELLLLFKKLMK